MAADATPTFDFVTQDAWQKALEEPLPNIEQFKKPLFKQVMSKGLFEAYYKWSSAPHPERRGRYIPARDGDIDSARWTIQNVHWTRALLWSFQDEADDRSGYLRTRANELIRNWQLKDLRVGCQLMEAAVNPLLLQDAAGGGPDDLGMFSTTDQFGVTGGNTVTGLTLTTDAGVEDAIIQLRQRLVQYRGSEGIGQLNQDLQFVAGITLYYSTDNAAVVYAAMLRKFKNISGDGGTRSNVIWDGSMSIIMLPTVHLSGNNIYIALNESPVKPLAHQIQQGLEALPQTRQNSDQARHQGMVGWVCSSLEGYGPGVVQSAVKGTA